jgi:hypothetical protein
MSKLVSLLFSLFFIVFATITLFYSLTTTGNFKDTVLILLADSVFIFLFTVLKLGIIFFRNEGLTVNPVAEYRVWAYRDLRLVHWLNNKTGLQAPVFSLPSRLILFLATILYFPYAAIYHLISKKEKVQNSSDKLLQFYSFKLNSGFKELVFIVYYFTLCLGLTTLSVYVFSRFTDFGVTYVTLLAISLFFARHIISFFQIFILHREYSTTNPNLFLDTPITRILLVTLLAPLFYFQNLYVILLVLIIKTYIEVRTFITEHSLS